jgi:fructose-1,6-bisphosphatase/inositol monophosphatase family enzyme
MTSPSELAQLAREVAAEAGELLRLRLPAVAGTLLLDGATSAKSSPTDMVTEIDRASESLIVGSLLRARPDDGILGEEGSTRKGSSGVTWIIDPLDGTTNYLYGIGVFAVSIAAAIDGRSVAGAVLNPLTEEMFVAAEGEGASLNGDELRLQANRRPLAEALVGTGFSYSSRSRAAQARLLPVVLPAVRDIRRAGAAALDLCAVACGRLDGYYEAWLEPWDLAAGELVAREAGATVAELEGVVDGSSTVVAAAPHLSGPLVALLEQAASS